MEQPENLSDLHAEHANWQNQILGFRQEIGGMNDKLGLIVSKHTPRDVPAHAEHFQNQFILQKDVLDIMRHDFKQYENMIEAEQLKSNTASDGLLQLRNAYQIRLNDYRRILEDLKQEFSVFTKESSVPV
jgi:hypothetical protein